MRRPARAVALPLAVVLWLLAGCTDDGARDARRPPVAGRDPAAAARINLSARDLGDGWQATPPVPTTADDEATERSLYRCLGAEPRDDLGDDVPSEDFSDTTGQLQISSSVDFAPTAADAAADLALLSAPTAQRCLRASLDRALRAGVSVTGATLDRVTVARDRTLEVVPGSVGYRLSTTITEEGKRVAVSGDVVALARGRVSVTVVSFGLGRAFPRALLTAAVRAVAARAEAEPERY